MQQVILLAHGSRDPRWQAPFETLLKRVRQQRPQQTVRLAYMELCEPSLAQIIAEGVCQGVTRFDILPLFFAAGRHLRDDVPAQLAQLRQQHPDLQLQLLPPVGEHPLLAQALAQIIHEQLAATPSE